MWKDLMSNSSASGTSSKNKKRHRITKALLIAAGTISLALGTIGIVLPILPTTPFLLLSAACYCRSSDRLYHWLINNKLFGEYIKNYREGKGIPLKTKILALTVLWVTIFYSAFFVIQILEVQLILVVVAVAVSVHILKLPTFKKA